ncbi:MAG: hypothetical protein IJF49_01720 [Clostridia bacterium]|nr:hypothetical protein [Clostridia bacterium]
MDNYAMIEKLKAVGVQFADGLSQAQITNIEEAFQFHFPKEISAFLSCAYPVGANFFDYRDTSPSNIRFFNEFQQNIKETFLFDIEHDADWLQYLLEEALGTFSEINTFKDAVLRALEDSPRLIPFYAHRCFLDGMDGMPIISFWQAVDTVFYGSDFENYLENEFLTPDHQHKLGEISDNMKNTGIWYHIIW